MHLVAKNVYKVKSKVNANCCDALKFVAEALIVSVTVGAGFKM